MALLLLFTAVAWAQVPEDDVLSGEQCKMCHADEHADWASTAHPESLEGLKTSDHADATCMHCMSTDYRYDETLTLETAKYGITCVACHNPHDTPGDDKPAIEDVGALCKECHNAELLAGETAEPGQTLRHSVSEMTAGFGAIGVDPIPSKHGVDCNTCHLEGHQFAPAQSACDTCHGGAATIEDATAAVKGKLEEYGAVEGLADGWPAAYTNYTLLMNDGSGGVHNPGYAAAIVAAIDAALAEPAAEEAAPEEAAPAEEEAAPAEEPAELPATGGVPLVSGPALLLLSGSIALAGGLGAYAWNRRK
jgi:predicted CXXCH cytochrome family protein